MKFVTRLVPIQLPIMFSLANVSKGLVRVYVRPSLDVLAEMTNIDPVVLAGDLIASAKEFVGKVCNISPSYLYDAKFSPDRLSFTFRTDHPIDEGKALKQWRKMSATAVEE